MIHPAFSFVRSKIFCRSAVSGQILAYAACTPKPLSVSSRTESNAVARDTKAPFTILLASREPGFTATTTGQSGSSCASSAQAARSGGH
jgi:hypothetical protein